jgi:hypothetical protein
MDMNRIFCGLCVWYPVFSGVVYSVIYPPPPEFVCNAVTPGFIRVMCVISLNRAFYVSRDVGILFGSFFLVSQLLSIDPP